MAVLCINLLPEHFAQAQAAKKMMLVFAGLTVLVVLGWVFMSMNLSRQIRLGLNGLMPPLAHVIPPGEGLSIQPMDELSCAYYFRFSALDQPLLVIISLIFSYFDV